MRVGLVVCAALLVSAPQAYASACNGGSCPAAKLLVTGIPTPESAGTVSSVTITVQTSQGATATAYTGTVHFTASDAQATLPANYQFTSCPTGCDNGVHKFTNGVVLKTAGTQTVTATDTASSVVKGSQTGIVVNPLSVSMLAVNGLTTPRAAGAAGTLTVTAKDPYGNTANGYLGRVHFTSSDGQAILPVDYTFTSTDSGTHSFSNGVTLKSAGTQSVNATDTSNGSISGGETGIVVNAGAASTLGVTGIATPRSANTVSSVMVTAKDAYGNKVTSYVGTVNFSSSDALALLPASYTFTISDAGVHTFANGVTLKTVGTQSVAATDTKTATERDRVAYSNHDVRDRPDYAEDVADADHREQPHFQQHLRWGCENHHADDPGRTPDRAESRLSRSSRADRSTWGPTGGPALRLARTE
jgi:hypothetical protein